MTNHSITEEMVPAEARVLRILRQEPQGLERQDIAELVGTDPKYVSNYLLRLAAKGLIERRRSTRRSNAFVYVARVE